MDYPKLPKKRRSFLCTKCRSNVCQAGQEDLEYPMCSNCNYQGFASDVAYNDDEMRAYVDADRAQRAAPGVQGGETQHPDDLAVDKFAAAMKDKLAYSRAKGRGGWDTPTCTAESLSLMLHEHVEKGDPLDVANFCLFLWAREQWIVQPATPQPVEVQPVPITSAELAAFWDVDPEAAYIAQCEHLNCPHCGGSGHVEDGTVQLTGTEGDAS